MSDVSHTATGAVAGSGGEIDHGIAGGNLAGAMPVYLHTDGKYYACQHDTAAHANAVALALHAAAAGQPVALLKRGTITLSGGLTTGVVYYVSTNAGGLAPVGDLGSADFITIVGGATSSTVLKLILVPLGVALG